MMKHVFAFLAIMALCAVDGAPRIKITEFGAQKITVSIAVQNSSFASSLKRNLELSGLFTVVDRGGTITVSGSQGASVRATGNGKVVTSSAPAGDDKSARMAARKLADDMCMAYGEQKGFACDRILFVNRKGSNNADLCVCYPDGYDAMCLTADAAGTVGPRWYGQNKALYTSLKSGPQIWEYDLASMKRHMKWSFKGLTTGAAVSPDGRRVAMILSFQGNPELYIIDGDRYTRLTNTSTASEGCPCWSPDGRQIVYMSDETRHPQLYTIDVATKKSRRITSSGSQNMEPDWGKNGLIAYVSGGVIKVKDPTSGEDRTVTQSGGWRHPSWSRDGRHLVAMNGNALFVVDTAKDGDAPCAIRLANGNWRDPCWAK